MFLETGPNDRDWDDELKSFRYIGRLPGCGCCGGWVGLTRANLEEHIQELEEKLENARSLLNEV
jgi:hypothetical protein